MSTARQTRSTADSFFFGLRSPRDAQLTTRRAALYKLSVFIDHMLRWRTPSYASLDKWQADEFTSSVALAASNRLLDLAAMCAAFGIREPKWVPLQAAMFLHYVTPLPANVRGSLLDVFLDIQIHLRMEQAARHLPLGGAGVEKAFAVAVREVASRLWDLKYVGVHRIGWRELDQLLAKSRPEVKFDVAAVAFALEEEGFVRPERRGVSRPLSIADVEQLDTEYHNFDRLRHGLWVEHDISEWGLSDSLLDAHWANQPSLFPPPAIQPGEAGEQMEAIPKDEKEGNSMSINARMVDEFSRNPGKASGLSVRAWATLMGCSVSTVQGTKTWGEIQKMREAAKHDRASDQGEPRKAKRKPYR